MGDNEALQCAEEGCNLPPLMNILCGHEACFYEAHKTTGMITVHTRECAHEGCTKTQRQGVTRSMGKKRKSGKKSQENTSRDFSEQIFHQ